MTIILVQPEIPQNTGTIARLCAVTGARLELVHPLGFATDDKHLRRAGLDYWHAVCLCEHADVNSFLRERERMMREQGARYFCFSRWGRRRHVDIEWRPADCLVFGPESVGLDLEALGVTRADAVRIPMQHGSRSLNLANAASIALYEALRQQGFPGLE